VKSGATLVLVAAVGILGALALADALRGEGETGQAAGPSTPAATTRTGPPTLLESLREEAVAGFVLYSDQDCRLHSLLLPRMVEDVVRNESGGDVFRCRFDVVGGRIVAGNTSSAGALAFREGAIVSGDDVVLTHSDLVRAARRHPNVYGFDRTIPLRIRVTGLAAFGVREPVVAMAISARSLEPQYLVALFDGHGVRTVAASFRVRVNGISTFLVGAPEGDQASRIIRLPIPARDLVWEPVSSGTSVGPPIRR
jgi:hypothetical protein